MENINKNSIFDNPQSFSDCIYKKSMIFINPKYETEFQENKFEKKNILLIIGICIFFTMFMIGLRITEQPFMNLDDLGRRYPSNPFAIFSLLWNIPLLIKAVIFFIPKLKIMRGFFFNTVIMIDIVYSSNYFSTVFVVSSLPLFAPSSILYIIIALIICFLYVANWICGSLQIIFIIGTFDYYMLSFNWPWISNKPIFTALSIITGFSVVLSIYYVEYFQRKSFYYRKKAEEQLFNLKEILSNLPDPIIISNQKGIAYENKAFEEILSPNDSKSISEQSVLSENSDKNIQVTKEEKKNEKIRHPQNIERPSDPCELLKNQSLNLNFKQILTEKIPLHSEEFVFEFNSFQKKFFEISSV